MSTSSYTNGKYQSWDDSNSSGTLSTVGKIAGIVIGALVGLAVLILLIVLIYHFCCKSKRQSQVWAHPCPRSDYPYGSSMYPHTGYPLPPTQQPSSPPKILEDLPPQYEEISTIENTASKA